MEFTIIVGIELARPHVGLEHILMIHGDPGEQWAALWQILAPLPPTPATQGLGVWLPE